MSKTDEEKEVHMAEIERTFNSFFDKWESDTSGDGDDFCEHAEQLAAVVCDEISFNEFIDNTGLKDIKDS